jgi:membrane associated rhomboid family serine protease
MWFLWIFGDNVEDALGKGRFVLFYLLTGLAGGIGHVITGPDSPLPTVGASGAVAGVMGAYMLMFPQARVIALVPILMVANLMEVPAAAFLGIWVLFQLASAAVARESLGGGTAWMAHVGGFAAGAAWALLMPKAHDEHSWVDRRRKQWRGW